MKSPLSVIASILLLAGSASTQSSLNFELVESVPVGTILDNPDIRNAHEVWLEMIKGAEKSLDIEEFYISDQKGELLEDVLQAIGAAAQRGVRVRLIVDARMHKTYPNPADSLGKLRNISLRVIDYGKLAGGVQHAKYFIVDGEQIFLGSQNFDWRALNHIHELGVRIRQKDAVAIYQQVFDLDWQLAATNERSAIAGILHPEHITAPLVVVNRPGDTIRFVPTMSPNVTIPDTMLWDQKQIVGLIDGAKKEVECQMLTYSPVGRDRTYYAELDNALRRAAVRGVKVRMIVSDWSIDKPAIDYLKSLAVVPNIEVKFSAIPDWSGGYIPFARVEHCKYLVSDTSACWIGTANWEKSYFSTTRNVGVAVQNSTFTNRVREIFFKGWDGPYVTSIRPEKDYTPREHGER